MSSLVESGLPQIVFCITEITHSQSTFSSETSFFFFLLRKKKHITNLNRVDGLNLSTAKPLFLYYFFFWNDTFLMVYDRIPEWPPLRSLCCVAVCQHRCRHCSARAKSGNFQLWKHGTTHSAKNLILKTSHSVKKMKKKTQIKVLKTKKNLFSNGKNADGRFARLHAVRLNLLGSVLQYATANYFAVCITFHKYDSVYLAGSSPTVQSLSFEMYSLPEAERNVIRRCCVS